MSLGIGELLGGWKVKVVVSRSKNLNENINCKEEHVVKSV
jgi:hypothetical protein